MSRGWVLVFLALIAADHGTRAYGQTSDIPPIPEHERFLTRNDLTVTLRLVSDRVQIDELPRITAVFKNIGTKRLLLRKPSKDGIHLNPAVTVYSNSGQLYPAIVSMCRCIYVGRPGRLRDLLALEPQQEYEVEVSVPPVAVPGDQWWEVIVQSFGLPPGDYFLRAVYQNAPDSAYPFYDVYESGAERAWEGLIETAPVRFSVAPPSDARLQDLIAAIDGSGNADAAVRIVRLARAPQAADALVRRLQRHPPGMFDEAAWRSALQVLGALGAIGDSEANSRLLAWIDTLSPQESSRAFSGFRVAEALQPLMRTASACSGRTFASSYGANGLREFVSRCPQLAAEARSTIRSPYDPNRQGGAWDAKASSVALLGNLGDPADVPLLLSVARGEEPALERGPRGTAVPSQTLMNSAVWALRQIASARVERVLIGTSAALLPDGVSRHDFLSQLRDGLSRLSAERVQVLTPQLLAATPPALMKLAVTLRHVDVPAPAVPESAEAATSDAPAAITKETFRELAMVDLVVSEDGEARLRAVEAITRFGTAAAFIPLRNALVLRPWDTAWDVDHALRELTFTDYGWSAIADPNEWDEWWRRNRGMTRRQWAEQAFSMARPAPTESDDVPAVKAFEYLRQLPNPPRGIVDKAARSQLWEVRVAAANAIAPSDRVQAMGLLLRELQNRMLGACRTAAEALNTVTNIQHQFDCGDPVQRARAIAFWARTIAEQPRVRTF